MTRLELIVNNIFFQIDVKLKIYLGLVLGSKPGDKIEFLLSNESSFELTG